MLKKNFSTFRVEKKHKKRIKISHHIKQTVSSFASSPTNNICVCVSVHHTHYDITGVHLPSFFFVYGRKLYDLSLISKRKYFTILCLSHDSLKSCTLLLCIKCFELREKAMLKLSALSAEKQKLHA